MKSKPQKGMRVRIKSINEKGKIFYVDWPYANLPHFHPIQVKLKKPYWDGTGWVRYYRTHADDLVRLKAKKKVKKRVKQDEDIFDFTQ